jgi:hypothetical protein
MAREDLPLAGAAAAKHNYTLCPQCKERAHPDARYCLKCGTQIWGPGEPFPALYSDEGPQKLVRPNLDHPEGCPACVRVRGTPCAYCHSFGMKQPSEKAHCQYCGADKKECCRKARELPGLLDLLQERFPGYSLNNLLRGRNFEGGFTVKDVMETWKAMYADGVAECRTHIRPAADPQSA